MSGLLPHARAKGTEGRLRPNSGTDVPLAHAIGREIIHAGLTDRAFVERATSGFEEYRHLVEPWTLSLTEKVAGVPAAAIRELAHGWARDQRAGLLRLPDVTEYDSGSNTDHVHALINLSLLTGHAGQQGSGPQRTPFRLVRQDPPVDLTDERYPVRLTTGRRLDSSNGSVRRGGSASPLRRGECIELSPEDAEHYNVVVGEEVLVSTRRESLTAPVWVDPALRPGLAFMAMRLPEEPEEPEEGTINQVMARASCPIAGAAEFKASAIRIEKLPVTATRI